MNLSSITAFLGGVPWGDIVWWYQAAAWIAANVLVLIIAFLVVVFVVVYSVLWDPKATTGGQLIFRFMVSLIGVVGLSLIGIWLDPIVGRQWYTYPGDVLWWRPTVRLAAYAYVAYATITLVRFLIVRKYWPEKLKIADKELIKDRDRHSK